MTQYSYLQWRPWLSILTLALSIFTLISTEMLPIGLLSPMAHSFNVSEGTISLAVSAPALIAAVTAPLILIFCAKINRKQLLLILMGLLLSANILTVIAPNSVLLLTARVLLGVSMGGIWTIAGGLASKIVAPSKAPLATSIIFSGVAAASVFGIPLGVYLGDLFHWQFAFMVMAMSTLLLILLLLLSLPSLPNNTPFQLTSFKQLLSSYHVCRGLIITFLLVAGHFMSYTFIRPLLQINAGFAEAHIGTLLFIYGLLGIMGNFVLGNLVYKHLKRIVGLITLLLTLSLILLQLFKEIQPIIIFTLIIWGFAYGAVSVSLMNWMFQAAPNHIEGASALYIGIFNFAIATGSFLGGEIYDAYGTSDLLLIATIIVFSAFLLTLLTRKIDA